jgi:hypothetical protein
VLNDTWYSRDLPVLTAIAENLVPFPARPKILGNLLVVSEHSISSEKDLTAGQANSILSLGSSLVHLYSGRIELPSGGIDLPDEQWKSGSGDETPTIVAIQLAFSSSRINNYNPQWLIGPRRAAIRSVCGSQSPQFAPWAPPLPRRRHHAPRRCSGSSRLDRPDPGAP